MFGFFFGDSLRDKEPADDMLAVCEELIRAKHPFPFLTTWKFFVKKALFITNLSYLFYFKNIKIKVN